MERLLGLLIWAAFTLSSQAETCDASLEGAACAPALLQKLGFPQPGDLSPRWPRWPCVVCRLVLSIG